jgi:outer membrane beta-barrel protein
MFEKTQSKRLFIAALAWALTGGSSLALAQDPPPRDAEAAKEGADTASAREERRESKKRKLADRIKSVERKVFLKKKRLEIYPFFALDLNDPFKQHFILGGSVAYHLADSFGLELRGGGVIASVDQSAVKFVRINAGAVCEAECPEFKYHADADLNWSPIYGKLSLFGEGILHFDTYLTAGAGVFGTDAGTSPAVNIGIGQRYFITDWLVARVELRDYIFVESRDNISDVQNLLILGFSVSGFFPTSFSYEFR